VTVIIHKALLSSATIVIIHRGAQRLADRQCETVDDVPQKKTAAKWAGPGTGRAESDEVVQYRPRTHLEAPLLSAT
jgi:hypothetical protein